MLARSNCHVTYLEVLDVELEVLLDELLVFEEVDELVLELVVLDVSLLDVELVGFVEVVEEVVAFELVVDVVVGLVDVELLVVLAEVLWYGQ